MDQVKLHFSGKLSPYDIYLKTFTELKRPLQPLTFLLCYRFMTSKVEINPAQQVKFNTISSHLLFWPWHEEEAEYSGVQI